METVLHTAAFKNIELSLSSVVRWKAVFPDQHFSSCPSYLLLRLNSWRVQLRGGVPVLSLSTPPPTTTTTTGQRLYHGYGTMENRGAPIALALASGMQILLWERQAEDSWSCCSSVPSAGSQGGITQREAWHCLCPQSSNCAQRNKQTL